MKDRFAHHHAGSYLKPLRRIEGAPITLEEADIILIESAIGDILGELPLLDSNSLFVDRLKSSFQHASISDPAASEDISSHFRPHSVSWEALSNTIAACAVPVKISNRSYHEMAGMAWAFFKKAYSCFPALLIARDNTLQAVQALLVMTLFMRTYSADTRTMALFLSTATRMLQMCNQKQPCHVKSEDIEIMSRVFWAAYILDVEVSTNSGLPPTLNDDDWDIDLPEDGIAEELGTSTNSIFRARVELAQIQSQVRRKLYASSKSASISDMTRLQIIIELESKLAGWIARTEPSIRPQLDYSNNQPAESSTLDPHVIMLHLAYYSCVGMLRWAAPRHAIERGIIPATPGEEQPVEHATGIIFYCRRALRTAARNTISLVLHRMPKFQFGDFRQKLHYPITAILILLNSILESYSDAEEARDDCVLINSFARFVRNWAEREGCDLDILVRGCFELANIAGYVSAAKSSTAGYREPAFRVVGPIDVEDDGPLSMQTTAAMLATLLNAWPHPIHLTQSLMGNMPRGSMDVAAVHNLWALFGGGLQDINTSMSALYGPFVPASMQPETFGFCFE
ncbi:fungal-specific transcription factor domain-containing protein [Podospora didyma]|uniref:Fungal-specific transcription factor domain-containing protein n=1 Tax=Podospora didyma TaxID=330526 RepID=A0AAE0K5R6_9PEZI|nr:fungal-specific transcription factor domain-containing protein [Podospora didyma]